MTCTEVRAVLPLWMYGEAIAEEAALREHLAHCAACSREQQAFEAVRQRLDSLAVPPVEVNLSRLYEAHQARQTRALRRWRRIAIVGSGLAALLLLALGLRLEIRMESHQVVMRWGESPPVGPAFQPDIPPVGPAFQPDSSLRPAGKPDLQKDMRLLSDLIHALKEDVENRDQVVTERLDRLQGHLRSLQAQADLRWNENKQDVAALYLLSHKGDKP